MSQQLIITGAVEIGLILMTLVLLIQPNFLFRGASQSKWRNLSTWSGLVLLCLTFCWSVIFGSVLFLHRFIMRI